MFSMKRQHLPVLWRKIRNLPTGLAHRYRVVRTNWLEIHTPQIISPWHVNILPAPRYKILYHSVPKAACSLLRAFMLELEGIDTRNHNLESLTRLAQARFLRPFVGRTRRYKHYTRFSFVRNPWSRLVSCYKSLQSRLKMSEPFFMPYEYPHINFKDMEFVDFVHFACATSERKSNHHFRSQHYFLCGGKMDFIGRFEHIKTDLHTLIIRYHLPSTLANFSDQYLNQSEDQTDYRAYYDKNTRRLVEERYEKDIRLFQYNYDDA